MLPNFFLPTQVTAFICGCGHSGTTLLATILSEHPHIFVPLVETEIFLKPDDQLAQKKIVDLQNEAVAARRPILVEKTPRHVLQIPRIRRLVPGARFILMVRDGRDVAASVAKRHGGDFEYGFRRWVDDNKKLHAELGKPDVMLLRYEDLVVAPELQLERVCKFLGVKFRPQMLNYHEKPHMWFGRKELRKTSGVGDEHNDHRNWQVNQPIFDGRGRWKTDLPPQYVERFKTGTFARQFMLEFGYDPVRPVL